MGDVIPAFKIGGTHAIVIFLYVFIMFSALHLATLHFHGTRFSKIMTALGW
jgi:hypothetical protein